MIIGCGGAGKSTLSRKLNTILGFELIHLDQHFWKPDWQETAKGEWEQIVQKLIEKDQWIIDGNFGSTMETRIKRADTIIFMDYSTLSCLWRITKRAIKYYNKNRPDMQEGCNERIDLQFYRYVANYNRTRRKKILERISPFRNEKTVYTFRNDKEVNLFLNSLSR